MKIEKTASSKTSRIKKNKSPWKRQEIKIKNKTQFLKKAKLFNQIFASFKLWQDSKYPVFLRQRLKKRYKKVRGLKKKLFATNLLRRQEFILRVRGKQNKKLKQRLIRRTSNKLPSSATITKKQNFWLNKQLASYQTEVPLKARLDFFQTNIGLILATAHRYSYNHPVLWRNCTQMHAVAGNIQNKEGALPVWRLHQIIEETSKWGLLYQSVHSLKKKVWHKLGNKFSAYQIFTEYWKEYRQRPWLTFLLYKRAMAAHDREMRTKQVRFHKRLEIKLYFRKKLPPHTKHNKFYQQLLTNTTQSESANTAHKKDKEKYTKNLLQKLIQPFYGISSTKNFLKTWKRVQRKKSANDTVLDFFLAKYECRLDVLVYRLNFAPNILWARRLIGQGAVFVTHTNEMQHWIQGHAQLKIYAYPLKLRDPKKLYAKQSWNPHYKQTRYNTLMKPTIRPNYIVKPNEIIQYNPYGALSKFKTNKVLTQKRVPSYLLTALNYKLNWVGFRHTFELELVGKSLADNVYRGASAFLLFKPQIKNLSEKDRIKETFFRWTLV
jgi:ribosomal protein S4